MPPEPAPLAALAEEAIAWLQSGCLTAGDANSFEARLLGFG